MSAPLLPHLVRALAEHSRWLHRQGIAAPPELTELLDVLTALSGHTRPKRDGSVAPADDAPVRLIGEAEVARCLSVSARTVRRLVATGDLPSVLIGRARRVHVDDVDAYISKRKGAA